VRLRGSYLADSKQGKNVILQLRTNRFSAGCVIPRLSLREYPILEWIETLIKLDTNRLDPL
jgi:hypothetical protein